MSNSESSLFVAINCRREDQKMKSYIPGTMFAYTCTRVFTENVRVKFGIKNRITVEDVIRSLGVRPEYFNSQVGTSFDLILNKNLSVAVKRVSATEFMFFSLRVIL